MKHFFAVEITTPEEGVVISRFFETLKAARTWATWTATKWPTRILEGGPGGIAVQ